MKKLFMATAIALAVCSCGTTRSAASMDSEVKIGFDKTARKNGTSASEKLRTSENDVAKYTDIYEYLRGRVPGLMVDVDTHEITIRGGVMSLYGDNEPLILVDGVEFQDLSGINPADVASVDVIKDGTASIYGAKGAAGVVHIHLKK